MRRLVQSACPCFWRATLRFLSLVTQFMSTRISPAQARAKCVAVFMENAGGAHCACIFPYKVAPSSFLGMCWALAQYMHLAATLATLLTHLLGARGWCGVGVITSRMRA